MITNNNYFVTFPVANTQTVPIGTLRLDFINGKGTLPNGTIIPMANRSTQIKPLEDLMIYSDLNINIILSLEDTTIYEGFILAGCTQLSDIQYDLLIITTSANTELFTAGSFSGDTNDD